MNWRVDIKNELRLALALSLAAMYLASAVHYPLHEHHGHANDAHGQSIGGKHGASQAHQNGDCAFCLISFAPVLAVTPVQPLYTESLTIHEGSDYESILTTTLDLSAPHRGPPPC